MERIELLKLTADPENILKGGTVHVEMSNTPLTDPEKELFEKNILSVSNILRKALLRDIMIKYAERG